MAQTNPFFSQIISSSQEAIYDTLTAKGRKLLGVTPLYDFVVIFNNAQGRLLPVGLKAESLFLIVEMTLYSSGVVPVPRPACRAWRAGPFIRQVFNNDPPVADTERRSNIKHFLMRRV